MNRIAILGCGLALLGMQAAAQTVRIDPARSTMTVKVGKSGLFSAFGHDHEIRAPISSGKIVSSNPPSVELTVDARRMQVLDPDLSAKDRAEVQRTMLSEAVLDVERYPEIRFTAQRIEAQGEDRFRVTGELALHGATRPVTVRVERRGERYTGSAKVKQTEFGIKPVTVAGGTVKVKDTVEIAFDIAPENQSPATAPGVERPAASGRSSPATATPSR